MIRTTVPVTTLIVIHYIHAVVFMFKIMNFDISSLKLLKSIFIKVHFKNKPQINHPYCM